MQGRTRTTRGERATAGLHQPTCIDSLPRYTYTIPRDVEPSVEQICLYIAQQTRPSGIRDAARGRRPSIQQKESRRAPSSSITNPS